MIRLQSSGTYIHPADTNGVGGNVWQRATHKNTPITIIGSRIRSECRVDNRSKRLPTFTRHAYQMCACKYTEQQHPTDYYLASYDAMLHTFSEWGSQIVSQPVNTREGSVKEKALQSRPLKTNARHPPHYFVDERLDLGYEAFSWVN